MVILGAGLDTRAYRLTRRVRKPGFRGRPAGQHRPEGQDGPAGAGRAATVGSTGGVGLRAATTCSPRWPNTVIAPTTGSFFICEGVTQYLTEDAVRRTLEGLRAAAPGSRMVFTYVRRDFIDGTNRYGTRTLYRNGPTASGKLVALRLSSPKRLPAFIGEYGWRLVEQAGPDELVAALRRAHRPQTQGVTDGVVGLRGEDLAERLRSR